MIYLYSGTPGSGKSLHCAKLIYDTLRYKRKPVIANFDICPDVKGYDERFLYLPNHELEPQRLYDFAAQYWGTARVKEDTILLVLDEAQLVFNSRNFQDKSRLDWIEFFSQHRHFGYRVIMIAQDARMIDRQIRALFEMEYKHRKLSNYGWQGRLLSLPFGGKMFLAVKYFYGLNDKVGQEWFLPRRKYYRLYDSYNRFRQADDTTAPAVAGVSG